MGSPQRQAVYLKTLHHDDSQKSFFPILDVSKSFLKFLTYLSIIMQQASAFCIYHLVGSRLYIDVCQTRNPIPSGPMIQGNKLLFTIPMSLFVLIDPSNDRLSKNS